MKSWYVATLLMVSYGEGEEGEEVTCEEQIRLLRACNEHEAYAKAWNIGKSEEHSYKNMYDKEVKWQFVGLENLEELSQKRLRSEQEIRSRFFKHGDPGALVSAKERLSIFLTNKFKHSEQSRMMNEKKPVD